MAGLGGGMEYHGGRLPARPRRPEPSWPTVIATTLRLWLERHPVVGGRGTRRRHVAVGLAAVTLMVLGGGGAIVVHAATRSSPSPAASRNPGPGSLSVASLGASAATRAAAATWIAGQVATSAIIA